MTTRTDYRAAAVKAYRAYQAATLADTRRGARIVWMSEQEGLGRRIHTGTATARAVAAAVAVHGYAPRWLDIGPRERVNLESLRECQGCERFSSARRDPRARPLRLETLSGDERVDAYEGRGFHVRFDPRRLP